MAGSETTELNSSRRQRRVRITSRIIICNGDNVVVIQEKNIEKFPMLELNEYMRTMNEMGRKVSEIGDTEDGCTSKTVNEWNLDASMYVTGGTVWEEGAKEEWVSGATSSIARAVNSGAQFHWWSEMHVHCYWGGCKSNTKWEWEMRWWRIEHGDEFENESRAKERTESGIGTITLGIDMRKVGTWCEMREHGTAIITGNVTNRQFQHTDINLRIAGKQRNRQLEHGSVH